MFERFTERARKVVVLAQEEARHFWKEAFTVIRQWLRSGVRLSRSLGGAHDHDPLCRAELQTR